MSVDKEALAQDRIRLSAAQQRRRRSRSVALALVLGGVVALFYLVTVAKLGSNILVRPL